MVSLEWPQEQKPIMHVIEEEDEEEDKSLIVSVVINTCRTRI